MNFDHNRMLGEMIICREISVDITLMILFFAAVLQFLESENQPHAYHTWMYVVWITIATVGYGDITPKTTLGKYIAIFIGWLLGW